MSGSLSFDRAAEYYDATRPVDPDTLGATLEVLAEELGGRGSVLEIGVGTGALALPLCEAGIPVVGVDLSMPMLAKLAEKAGGAAPFPLVQADATRLPFDDESFGGAYLRWVLHLIPGWRDAVAELARLVRPGGVIVIEPGGYTGAWREVWSRFVAEAGPMAEPVGLNMRRDLDELDPAMIAVGTTPRALPEVEIADGQSLADWFSQIEERRYSWTWRADEDDLMRSVATVREWARERYGDLDTAFVESYPLIWRAYDVG